MSTLDGNQQAFFRNPKKKNTRFLNIFDNMNMLLEKSVEWWFRMLI